MGSNKSKISENVLDFTTQNILFDPRSPDINRTPISHRLNYNRNSEPIQETPIKEMRKVPLNNSSKESRFLDPRSPSQFIPRTPLRMSRNEEHIESSSQLSLEYSGCIEEASCRTFNERLENMTFENCEESKSLLNDKEMYRVQNTPNIPEIPKNKKCGVINTDIEITSPVFDSVLSNKRNTKTTFSSTPISILNDQPKSLFNRKHATDTKTMDRPCIDVRLNKCGEVERSRTPFGSLLNDQCIENLPHTQPQQLKIISQPIGGSSTSRIIPKSCVHLIR